MKLEEILELVKHMKTDTPEQKQEKYEEVMRIIRVKHEEEMRIIQEKHDEAMLKIQVPSIENIDLYRMQLQIRIQEIRARTPKRQIYFGKVKTE